jgi:glycosyltransferase involved in cell wall biosynthesis
VHVVHNMLGMPERKKHVHLINPLWSAAGGSEWRTLNLFDLLKDHCDVHLWSEHEPDPLILEKYPVKRIVPKLLRFPKTGTFVFVGAYFPVGPWIRYTRPRRTIFMYNTPTRSNTFFPRLEQLTQKGRRKVEVVYPSELLKRSVNYPGWVQLSPVDIEKFAPPASKLSGSTPDEFTIGRLSRGVRGKHHPDDPALYRQLINHGCRIRIMGATPRLTNELSSLSSVTLLPPLAEEPHLFLRSLDCFFYRTHPKLLESWGRVVIEAMACGLPVVCHNRGGYVDVIDHGRNGFLFDTQQEAMEILLMLKDDRALRKRIGVAARKTSEELFSSAWKQEVVQFYLQ